MTWKLAWLPCACVLFGLAANVYGRESDRLCESRVQKIGAISDKGLQTDDELMKGFLAEGAKNNACLLSMLRDRRLRPNPFLSRTTSLVTNSEVALSVLARVNHLDSRRCFPPSFRTTGAIAESDYHAWFLQERNVDQLAEGCKKALSAPRAQVPPNAPDEPMFPQSECIDQLKGANSAQRIRSWSASWSPQDLRCVVDAVQSTELMESPPGVSLVSVIPVGDVAVFAISNSSRSRMARDCGVNQEIGQPFAAAWQDRLKLWDNRDSLYRCLKAAIPH